MSNRSTWRAWAAAGVGLCLAASLGTTGTPTAAATAATPSLDATPCPPSLPADTSCYAGQQPSGAHYLIAVPEGWDGDLVVHAHGGPDLGAATPERVAEDLDRWSVMVAEGYAWVGSSYRRGGYGTRMAAADTEEVRRLFVDAVGEPGTTLLHGQSWGGLVAAKTAEVYGGRRGPYDGVLLTNGVLAGATRGYDYRLDLRVVYQHYCGNHPRPSEPSYELWRGLPAGSTMTAAELRRRAQECTGYQSPPEQRTPQQRARLADILAVTQIPERSFYSHLSFATFTFRDIVHTRLHDRNPFTNLGVAYRGSSDDRSLNRGVLRYRADAGARRDLSFDSDLTGEIAVPVLTLHAIDDPTAFVEHESAFRRTLDAAGNAHRLVQTFTRESEHSALSDSGYATAIGALHDWVTLGRRPSSRSIERACARHDLDHGQGCFFDAGYRPGSYFDRVHPRPGHTRWPALDARDAARWERIGGIGIDY
ncbi:hypothetical protein ASE01_23595 [Nocardioides sp. Root190]|uniref:hypothetical protein n=1 Tax=Nocardioides sp. Root190 TaxID=1736488 RepID=UPI0007012947|nr:hypothetical protein [Nocardioides sp. Root190]KRB78932.1 hypothetical protein ASE01_23595 [Nocardioides sp. Root190]